MWELILCQVKQKKKQNYLEECIIVDKLLNGELGENSWGIVENPDYYPEEESNPNRVVLGINHPSFRGPLLIAMDTEHLASFINEKNSNPKSKKIKFPKYKGKIDETYSNIMSNILLPTSPYFKKYISEKYAQNPESSLYEQLAVDFVGNKKIKPSKNKSGNSGR